MEYLGKMLKKTGIISIIESVIFIIIGIILIWKAELAIKVISYILGITFIVFGIIKVIQYLNVHKDDFETYNYELIFGLMAIIIGIITMYYGSAIETILRIIIGVWIIYSSLVKFILSLRMKKLEVKVWGYSILLSIIMFICGLYVILNAGVFISVIGAIMIVYSVIDIIDDVICLKYIKEIL